MARPFRLQPPSPAAHPLPRGRLLAALAERWNRRLVTVIGGPGFGKTMLLAAAIANDAAAAAHRDVWLSCEPADEAADHLGAGLARAFGLEAGAGVDAICDAVWALTPHEVCVVLDDVHEVPDGSSGAALLARLLTDLPGNGHLVLASRAPVPVPTARLAASRQLVRLTEADLVFDRDELASFAVTRSVDPSLLASAGGWPALAELTATTGSDLVLDYLWEEVLARVGPQRANALARFAVVGGGDDGIATALAGEPVRAADLVAGLPLVERSGTGWASLHPLWNPALRRLISETEAADARRRAAEVHRRAGRLGQAVDLFADAEAWDDLLALLRESQLVPATAPDSAEMGRWGRMLPASLRHEPEALLATGLEAQARAPLEALSTFQLAADGFRARGDIAGELATIHQLGLVLWWANDMGGLQQLFPRVLELAAGGSSGAQALVAVGLAAFAHATGDSDGVLSALDGVEFELSPGWLPTVHWFRSVAHRRAGNLGPAYRELDAASGLAVRDPALLEVARLRTDWLRGDVDHVRARLADFRDHYELAGHHFLATETTLELAGKLAWLGDTEPAAKLLRTVDHQSGEPLGALAHILHLIARATIAVGEGDETAAAAALRNDELAVPGHPESWYWRDRGAVALLHVLAPETRSAWAQEPLGNAHTPGLQLALVLEAARQGDLEPARSMVWPAPGIVRANLPLPWVVELAAAGFAAGNPPSDELRAAVEPHLHTALGAVARTATAVVAGGARQLLAEVPSVPPYRLRICVLGPMEIRRDGTPVDHPDLRRQRVRDLLTFLIIHRRARREAVAEALWPDIDDPRHNLRVTLNYLQRVLQPERTDGDTPFFVRTAGAWLELEGGDQLEVDAWELEDELLVADSAERDGAPAAAIASYAKILPLWQGELLADVPYADWAQPPRVRWVERYTAAALRAGELHLAAGATSDARSAAEMAILAEPSCEAAYRVLARARLAEADHSGARRAIDQCRAALAKLDTEPAALTLAVLAAITDQDAGDRPEAGAPN